MAGRQNIVQVALIIGLFVGLQSVTAQAGFIENFEADFRREIRNAYAHPRCNFERKYVSVSEAMFVPVSMSRRQFLVYEAVVSRLLDNLDAYSKKDGSAREQNEIRAALDWLYTDFLNDPAGERIHVTALQREKNFNGTSEQYEVVKKLDQWFQSEILAILKIYNDQIQLPAFVRQGRIQQALRLVNAGVFLDHVEKIYNRRTETWSEATALTLAVKWANTPEGLELLRALVARGANLSYRDSEGRTAEDWAKISGNRKATQLLTQSPQSRAHSIFVKSPASPSPPLIPPTPSTSELSLFGIQVIPESEE